ncbi:MAG TPA: ABC transporter ATP-binding protein [Patescibacteria group bacterium]
MTKAVVVKDLTKKYRKAKENAVDGISFSVNKGDFFTFLGPNGAGKTTTISILTTTLSKTSGKVDIAGFDLDRDSTKIRQKIGIIFQNPSLDLNLTAEENIRFHACLYGLYSFRPSFAMMSPDYKNKVMDLAKIIGLEKEIGKPVKTFSGGMKRKLEIVRSLIHNPEILFLDEPTTGLDPLSRRNLWSYLHDVRRLRGTTIFLTTHYLEEAEKSDAVCIINHGRIVSSGTPDDIKKQLVREYVMLDAADRPRLEKELDQLDLKYTVDGNIKVFASAAILPQIINSLTTPISFIKTHTPTLEDAYLEAIDDQRD